MLNNVLNLLYKNKALNIKIICNRNLYSDYIIITTCTSIKHIKQVNKDIKKSIKQHINLIAGINTNWAIISTDFITIHMMTNLSRNKYNLENLYINDY